VPDLIRSCGGLRARGECSGPAPWNTINGALSPVVLRYRELNFKCIEILCGVVKHEVSSTTCARDTPDLDVYAILYSLNPVQWNITFEVSRYTLFE
jgi:hypothetical protein